jgi:LPXTG-motif cell wall-anchored protein
VAKFKNGDTWHESPAYIASYNPPKDGSKKNSYLLPLAAIALILIAAGGYLYRKRKISEKTEKSSKSP